MLAIYVTGLVLIALVAWAVASPFFEGADDDSEMADATPGEARWRRQRSEALAAIRDAELDFHLGKLSESDYREMRERLEMQALEAIRALEGGGKRDRDR